MQDASAAFRFDPANIERMFLQDLYAQDGTYPWWPSVPQPEIDTRADGALMLVWTPSFEGWYKLDLPKFIANLRNAVLLPFCDEFLAWLNRLLEMAERESFKRAHAERERAKRARLYGESDWASANLVAEVESVCGMGRRVGGEYWFRCPFHDDRNPSLEVNAEKRVWRCWGCGKAGGVVDWRRRV